jgi:hypothetical protein
MVAAEELVVTRMILALVPLAAFVSKVLVLGFLCATSVSSVSLWCGFTRNSSTTETQRTQRLHREERDREFLCKARLSEAFAPCGRPVASAHDKSQKVF